MNTMKNDAATASVIGTPRSKRMTFDSRNGECRMREADDASARAWVRTVRPAFERNGFSEKLTSTFSARVVREVLA